MKKLNNNELNKVQKFNSDISNIQSDIADLEEKLRNLRLKKSKEVEKFNSDIEQIKKELESKREAVKNIRDKITSIKKENIMKKSELKRLIKEELLKEKINSSFLIHVFENEITNKLQKTNEKYTKEYFSENDYISDTEYSQVLKA